MAEPSIMTKRTILVPVDDTAVSPTQAPVVLRIDLCLASFQIISTAVLQDSERAVDWALANLYQKGANPLHFTL